MTLLARLVRRADQPVLRAIGLLSGTSADGIDAALVEVSRDVATLSVRTLAARTTPLTTSRPPDMGRATAEQIAMLARTLGREFADAALAVMAAAEVAAEDVDVIGCHGQTVIHLPGRGEPRQDGTRGAVTFQVGDAAMIRERTGVPVVHDFRSADTAAAGEGAPLVPLFDWLLLRPERGARIALNVGGIANATRVTPRLSDVEAFDTGPGNGPLDSAVRLLTGGTRTFDRDGEMASRGRPDQELVEVWLRDPVLRAPPPRSFDRGRWGSEFVAGVRRDAPELSDEDLMASLTEFVARATRRACREHLGATADDGVSQVIVSGGGVHNGALMTALSRLFAPIAVVSASVHGVDPDAKEAVLFAVLACEFLRGRTGNLPGVTGASGHRVLGSVIP